MKTFAEIANNADRLQTHQFINETKARVKNII